MKRYIAICLIICALTGTICVNTQNSSKSAMPYIGDARVIGFNMGNSDGYTIGSGSRAG